MKLLFLGAAHEVTGSCTLLTACGHNILIDCGMEQGADTYENVPSPIAPGEVDCVLLTHAHIDHSGRVPMLVANGYKGHIHATRATAKLCSIMLVDSAHIQESEAAWRNRKARRAGVEPYRPLYTIEDARKTLELFRPCDYGREIEIFDGVKVEFTDAGHLLGSACIKVTVNEDGVEKSVLFSGDLGNVDRPLIRNPQIPGGANYVVCESTYGDRVHGPRPDYISQLSRVIRETFARGGNVVIPSFAVGRTQEMLYLFREIKNRRLGGKYNDFQVWVDSPLAVEATGIYTDDMTDYYDADTLSLVKQGINPISFDGLRLSVTTEQSIAINSDKTPKVILSASGMCEAGRIRHHLKHNLWRPECTVLFVGYQSEGSLGRILLDGAKTVKLFGEEIRVNAHIEMLEGISGHADRDILLGWLDKMPQKPDHVFVNHGADSVCDIFADTIRKTLGISASAPYSGSEYDLLTGTQISAGNRVRIVKKDAAARRLSAAFERLMMAGRRLMMVIERNRGGTNKDLAKFTSQINDLCDKWER